MFRQPILAALALACAIATAPAADPAATTYGDITHADLVRAIKEKAVTLLDANGSESYAKAHIPTAHDFAALSKAGTLASVLPKDKAALVVAYCGSPKCGAYKAAADAATALGYTNVKHFSAGIKGWLAANAEAKACPLCAKEPCGGKCQDKPAACATCTKTDCGGCPVKGAEAPAAPAVPAAGCGGCGAAK